MVVRLCVASGELRMVALRACLRPDIVLTQGLQWTHMVSSLLVLACSA